MNQGISPIIQAEELLKIYQQDDVVLIDASNGKDARVNYNRSHLDKALFVDVNAQLSDIKEDASQGGRHPLPSIEQFSATLTQLGISSTSRVVIYDDNNGANAAARFWWMLKSIGHSRVQVLNGGIQEAIKIGFPSTTESRIPNVVEPYKIENWQLPIADIIEVEKATHDDKYLIVDVRDTARFNGVVEPIDLVSGHIPNAMNIPFINNLDKNGLYLSTQELKHKYLEVFNNKKFETIIVHCGSGVTACHTLLALSYAGLQIPKLYVGSWSEWSRSNKPMVTKNNKE